MKPVFISYSRDDGDFVNRLRDDLLANAINVWLDKTGLKPGTRNWEQALREAIRDAQAMVLVASPSSRQSNYVQGELEIAEMYRCPVYPVWAAGEIWADCIPLALIKMQYIDARANAYEAAVPQLVEALGEVSTQTEHLMPEVGQDFEPRNPYKGLRAFQEGDVGDFFGRETLIEELVEALRERIDTNPLLAVIGPSGSGKSSVVLAGLLPRLRAGALPGSAKWVYLDPMVPGARPLESLCTTLANALPQKANTVIRQDLDDPDGRGLHLLACQITRRIDKRLVLLIDQFEELFIQTIEEDERRQFITLLVTAVTEPKGPVTAVLTLRADFYDRPMEYPALFELLKTHQSVPPLSLEDLRAVIEKPAALPDVQLQFEEDLVGDLLFEVREQMGGLPLLQFTLDQLFQQRDHRTLTLAAYRDMGGLRGALARHAEETYAGLPTKEHRKLTRTLFLRLIEPGQTEQDTTRRRANMTELELPDTEQTQILREVTDAFVTARLLTTGDIAGKAIIEVSHEALIREWGRLGAWMLDAREDVRLQKAVSADAAEWTRRGRRPDDDVLYRGTVLNDAQTWMRRNAANNDEVAFIEASVRAEATRKAEEKRIARQVQDFRWASIVLGIVFLLAVIATIAAVLSADSARDERSLTKNEAATAWEEAEIAGTERAVILTSYAATFYAVRLAGDATVAAIGVQVSTSEAVKATAVWQATYFALEQERASTLVAGGIVSGQEGTHAPDDFIATLTQVAYLSNWTPIVELDEFGVAMVQVPAGCFWMGSIFQPNEQPIYEVCFEEPFWIDRFEVTNGQFKRLGGVAVAESTWSNPDQPRTDIAWFEAQAFCESRGGQLPSEAQWEYAARGVNSLIYPWGNEFISENVAYLDPNEAEITGEDQRRGGQSWVGAYDMSGNVWEWTNTIYDQEQFPYPYNPDDGREAYSEDISIERLTRGGGFMDVPLEYPVRTAFRSHYLPRSSMNFVGFRCVRLDGSNYAITPAPTVPIPTPPPMSLRSITSSPSILPPSESQKISIRVENIGVFVPGRGCQATLYVEVIGYSAIHGFVNVVNNWYGPSSGAQYGEYDFSPGITPILIELGGRTEEYRDHVVHVITDGFGNLMARARCRD